MNIQNRGQNSDLLTKDVDPPIQEEWLDVPFTDQDMLPFKTEALNPKENYAFRIAIAVLSLFGVTLLGIFRLPVEGILPYIQGVWGVFGTILTFVLGYYFGGNSHSGTTSKK